MREKRRPGLFRSPARIRGLPSVVVCSLSVACGASPEPGAFELRLQASDGVHVWGDLHRGGGIRPLVLLFHQGGSNARAEYDVHVPLLMQRGFDVLAVDARAGGERFGGSNRTAAALPPGSEPSYCSAEHDLSAALDHALTLPGVAGKPGLWGSVVMTKNCWMTCSLC